MRTFIVGLAAAGAVGLGATGAAAEQADLPTVSLTLKDHRFSPESVTVPAGTRVRIELSNLDGALEEFDSEDLRVERDVTPHGKESFVVGPLKPGAYSFMGELHAETASGQLIAVEGR